MRPHEVFASMPSEHTTAFFTTLAQECPGLFTQAVQAASIATKSRPQYLLRQPLDKRAAALRRVLARVASGPMAEEILATYFVDCRKEVLVAWLDRFVTEFPREKTGRWRGASSRTGLQGSGIRQRALDHPRAAQRWSHRVDERGREQSRNLRVREVAQHPQLPRILPPRRSSFASAARGFPRSITCHIKFGRFTFPLP